MDDNGIKEGMEMTRIAEIERPGVTLRAFYKIGERMFGQVPTPERLMAHRPPLMLGLGGLYGSIEWFGKIDPRLRALLNVQVAALYGSPYWMDIRHAVGVRVGLPEEELAAVTAYADSPYFTEREKVALAFSEQITRADQEVSDECFSRLRQHFSEAEVVELAFIVGYQTFASKFAKAFQLAPQGFSRR
jgi:alkylhydroperoxidase family enzyme